MRITLLGAGHIGQTIARLLGHSGDFDVTVVDRSEAALAALANEPVRTRRAETSDAAALLQVLRGQDAVVNALPYHLATLAATQAREAQRLVGRRYAGGLATIAERLGADATATGAALAHAAARHAVIDALATYRRATGGDPADLPRLEEGR